jgi:hypothetical protein
MNIFSQKTASSAIVPGLLQARSGRDRTGDGVEYQEFLFGLNLLLGEKWGEKNPLTDDIGTFAVPPGAKDGKPAKQLQSIEMENRERLQSAIHQKEMTKWQTHP